MVEPIELSKLINYIIGRALKEFLVLRDHSEIHFGPNAESNNENGGE